MKHHVLIAFTMALGVTAGAAHAQQTVPPNPQSQPTDQTPMAGPTQQTPDAANPPPGAAGSAPATSTPSVAQATMPVAPKAGEAVYDNAGASIGTVASVASAQFVLSTTKGKATLPVSALARGDKGLMVNTTKAQVDAAILAANKGKSAQ